MCELNKIEIKKTSKEVQNKLLVSKLDSKINKAPKAGTFSQWEHTLPSIYTASVLPQGYLNKDMTNIKFRYYNDSSVSQRHKRYLYKLYIKRV